MNGEEDVVGRLVGAAGAREPLPDELKERWSAHFRGELGAALRRRTRRRLAVFSACAAAAIAVVVWIRLPTQDVLVARIVDVSGEAWRGDEPIAVAGTIAAGDEVRTSGSGRIAAVYRGVDLRCDVDTAVRMREEEIELLRGSLYVDAPQGAGRVRVTTPYGVVSHVGTQFMVTVQPALLVAAVRQGRIVVETDGAAHEFTAERTAVHVSVADGHVTSIDMARHDGPWAWVNRIAPTPSFDGRPASAVLDWYAHETGRVVRYVDDRTQRAADINLLQGISDLAADEVPGVITAITRLNVTLIDDGATIEVRRRSERE